MVDGWMVSPRKSRKKSACFSRTSVSTPRAGEEQAEHHPSGPTADDAAAARNRFCYLVHREPSDLDLKEINRHSPDGSYRKLSLLQFGIPGKAELSQSTWPGASP
jgi:hypothetical protein